MSLAGNCTWQNEPLCPSFYTFSQKHPPANNWPMKGYKGSVLLLRSGTTPEVPIRVVQSASAPELKCGLQSHWGSAAPLPNLAFLISFRGCFPELSSRKLLHAILCFRIFLQVTQYKTVFIFKNEWSVRDDQWLIEPNSVQIVLYEMN